VRLSLASFGIEIKASESKALIGLAYRAVLYSHIYDVVVSNMGQGTDFLPEIFRGFPVNLLSPRDSGILSLLNARCSLVVEALCYKPEGRGVASR
jgi:hypothetical protein